MISNRQVKNYCCEDPSLIENYYKAINDTYQTWEIHHRREIDENKSVKQLIDEGLYYYRPASELIFLTKSEHSIIHNKDENNPLYGRTGKNNPNYGKKRSKETKRKQSEIRKRKFETGEIIAWNKGKKGLQTAANKGKHRVYDNKELNKYHYE